MLLKAVIGFNDLAAGVWREKGETWEADEARLESLSSSKWGPLAEAAEPEKKAKRAPKGGSKAAKE